MIERPNRMHTQQELWMSFPKALSSRLFALLAAFGIFLSAGCAEQIGDIDRTNPNKIRKDQFTGQWYLVRTVTDAPYGVAWTFVGEQSFGSNPKVVFDIQQNHLIAYPVSEKLAGAEKGHHSKKIRRYWDQDAMEDGDESNDFAEMYVGQPMAAFKITKHFDVKRQYNPATGEEGNILEENDYDRPWYEREYVRVDWSQNDIADFEFVAGRMETTGVPYYVQEVDDPENPDRPEFDDGYISVVLKMFVTPASTGSCSVYTLAPGDCAGGVVRARYSFERVNPIPTYNPQTWHNAERQDKFGYFQTDRYTYNETTGVTYSGQETTINRWNMWRQVWNFVDLPEPKSCLNDDNCAKLDGEFCYQERWFQGGVCKKRVLRRPWERYDNGHGVKPIIYHMSASFPEHLIAGSYAMADNWNDAFKETMSWMLFWDEKDKDNGGMYFTRFCNVDADCAAGATLQTQVGVSSGGSTVIAYDDGNGAVKTIVTIDGNYPDPSLSSGRALARFVHAQPDAGAVDFVDSNGGSYQPSLAYDPDATYESYQVIDPGLYSFEVHAGGAKVAEYTNVNIKAAGIYLFVYGGGTLALAESSLLADASGVAGDQGLRVINMLPGTESQNIVVNGARRAEGVGFGQGSGFIRSEYQGMYTVTLVSETGRQDVTCFHQATDIGRCAGSKPKLVQTDYDRRSQIEKELPDIFVLCRNKFSGAECGDNTGQEGAQLDCRYTWDDENGAQHNPCRDDVARPDSLKKNGDARYNLVYYVSEAQSASPLGYGPSAADPDTGEIHFAAANIYGPPLMTYSRYAQDILDLVNGDLSPADTVSGRYIRQHLKGLQADGLSTMHGALSFHGDHDHDHALVPARLPATASAALDISLNQPLGPATSMNPVTTPEYFQFMRDKNFRKRVLNEVLGGFPTQAQLDARFSRIAGTELEQMMINNEVKVAMSGGALQPGDAVTPEDVAKLSPLAWGTQSAIQAERERMRILSNAGNTCVFMGDFIDDAVLGLAQHLKQTGHTGEDMRKELERMIYQGVVEHEVGHTVGLRHNFSGSSDVYNFFDEYYDIREREKVPCQGDSWCEISGNEECMQAACQTAADCGAAGMSCGPAGTCVDSAGVETGFCATKKVNFTCAEGCPENSGSVCDPATNMCSIQRPCNTTADCLGGETCPQGGGVCMAGGAPALTVYEVPESMQVLTPVMKFLPRPYMTEAEKLSRRTEYQYSSIMDYGGRFNSDFEGLGKYDVAAIKAGYGNLLEIYRDTSGIDRYIETSAKAYNVPENQFGFVKDTTYWRYGGTVTSAFENLENAIGVPQNLLRDSVPWDAVRYEHEMTSNFQRGELDWTYIEVPFKACYDEYRGNLGCYYFDTGIDIGEMIYHAMNSLQYYYIFDAFKRERYSYGRYGSASYYFARILDRYMGILGHAGQYFALYSHIFKDYSWFPTWKVAPYQGRTLRVASETGFQYLNDLLASPAPGSFRFDPATQRFKNFSFDLNAPGSELNIPIGLGKFPYTRFQPHGGYYDFEHALWIGSFWEKMASLLTLTDSTAYFTMDFAAELDVFGGTAIGFNTMYQAELTQVLGGIITSELDRYAGVADAQQFRSRPVIGPGATLAAETNAIVEPSIHDFTLQLYSAVYGLAYLPAGFDPAFIDSLAIVYKGNGSEYELNPDVTSIEFEDPFGSKTYMAFTNNYQYEKDEYGNERRPFPAAYRLVEKANEVKAEWANAAGAERFAKEKELKDLIVTLDLLRQTNDVFGTLQY